MYHSSDIPQWSEVKLSDNEVPLKLVAESIRNGTGRFNLRQSKQVPNAWTLWDVTTENVAILTHAFVIRWTSPLDTGNLVLAGKPTPSNLTEGNKRSEPGPNVQVSIAFDCRMDDTVHRSLATIEKWVETDPKFNPDRVPRSQWMTPEWVASNSKLIVNSQLFSVKTPFNTKPGKIEIPYNVHPWISEACQATHSTWMPNPNRVLFYDAQFGVLEDLGKCSDPRLVRGDLVKMSFRFVFNSGRSYWQPNIRPMQIIRVGQVSSSVYGSMPQEDEPVGICLPKLGQRVAMLDPTEPTKKMSREASPEWDIENKDSITDEGSPAEERSSTRPEEKKIRRGRRPGRAANGQESNKVLADVAEDDDEESDLTDLSEEGEIREDKDIESSGDEQGGANIESERSGRLSKKRKGKNGAKGRSQRRKL